MVGPGGRPSSSRSLGLALVQLGVGVAMCAGIVSALLVDADNGPTWILLLFVLVAVTYAAAGLLAWRRRPSNRLGAVMVFGGLAWLAAALINTDIAALVAVGLITSTVPVALVIHLLHAFPSGRLLSRASRVVVVAAYVTTTVLQIPIYALVADPGPTGVLSFADRPDLARLGAGFQAAVGSALMVATTVILISRLRRADRSQRRVLAPLYAYGVLAVLLVSFSANILEPMGLDPVSRAVLQLLVLGGVPVAFVLGVLRGGFRQTGEIVELGSWLGTGSGARPGLRDALAATLGDPTLELVFWSPELQDYLDGHGRPVRLPDGPDRAAVEIDLAGRRVGAISYDATSLADPDLVRQAGRVVAIAVDRDRLTAEVLASRDALRSSRARIVEAGDTERRRVARDLHDGVQVQLVLLALEAYALGDDPTASASVQRGAVELRAGIDATAAALRRLVHGVMPALLIERGLFAATEDLVDRMPIPTELGLSGDDRGLPPTVQSTAYFAISEGLSNAVKHSGARRLTVRLDRHEELLQIEIRDDGVGGAAPGGGAGLRGMADRVDVLGGTFELESRPSDGTRLWVEVPCGS